MVTEFRIIFTAIFSDAADRDAYYSALKSAVPQGNTGTKRADMTKDQYAILTDDDKALVVPVAPVTEQVI